MSGWVHLGTFPGMVQSPTHNLSIMNLFWSEEHGRSWSGFKAGTEQRNFKLSALVDVFSGKFIHFAVEP